MTDTPEDTEDDTNIHYRESLTAWGETCSVQVRNLGELAFFHYENAPRLTEDGFPYAIPTLDAILLRDLLNAATARGFLPKPDPGSGAAEDAATIGSRPTFVDQVSRAYAQGIKDAPVYDKLKEHDEQSWNRNQVGLLHPADQALADKEHDDEDRH